VAARESGSPLHLGNGDMWGSSKKPPKKRTSILPPSQNQLLRAKESWVAQRTQFHFLQKEWVSLTRKPVEPEVVAAAAKPSSNASAPAWMNYRTKAKKAPPIYFRTKPVDRKKPT
jgi:hypothetical protein